MNTCLVYLVILNSYLVYGKKELFYHTIPAVISDLSSYGFCLLHSNFKNLNVYIKKEEFLVN